MPEFVITPGSRVAVLVVKEGGDLQHPVYGPGAKVTLTEDQAEPLLASKSIAEPEPAGDKGKK
jgi:hypothetical protein